MAARGSDPRSSYEQQRFSLPRSLSKPSGRFQPNSPSCGNQPANISLTARRQDTLTAIRHRLVQNYNAPHGPRREVTSTYPLTNTAYISARGWSAQRQPLRHFQQLRGHPWVPRSERASRDNPADPIARYDANHRRAVRTGTPARWRPSSAEPRQRHEGSTLPSGRRIHRRQDSPPPATSTPGRHDLSSRLRRSPKPDRLPDG